MPEVVVVGGGLSGLVTACALHRAGRRVLLLEARPRLGGRILSPGTSFPSTTRMDGTSPNEPDRKAAFDLGPAWIWPGQRRVAALSAELGVPIFPQPAQGALVWDDGSGSPRRGVFDAHGGAARVVGGVEAWIRTLAAELPAESLRLEHPVTAIRRAGPGIEVTVARPTAPAPRTLEAERGVLALPPRLIAKLDLDPPLPAAERDALAAVPTWMAGEAKLVAVYATPFWRAEGLSGDAFGAGVLGQIYDASPADGRVGALGAFLRLDGPERGRWGRARIEAESIAQLVRTFGTAAAAPRALLYQDWFEEPRTATEADAVRPRSHPAYGPPRHPSLWGGRLVLSGSELAPELGGYLEGALAASEATVAALGEPVGRRAPKS